MPTLTWNRDVWAVKYDWSRGGEEWSEHWGNSEAQWFHAIYPRIHRMVPAPTILEIAPGYGRWTQYLLPMCERLIGVDMAPTCVEACKTRFGGGHAEFYVNDGENLGMLPDESVDFVFSFDSLVHANAVVMKSYIKQFPQKLKGNGCGFLHHSNMGAYNRLLGSWALNPHMRDPSMSADLFKLFCDEAGLGCPGQELINWVRGRVPWINPLTDCLSIIAKRGGIYDEPHVRVENNDFMAEAHHARRTQPLYERIRDKGRVCP
jgi:hypothetical protein